MGPSIMPWQFGQLGLTESGGNRLFKYSDAIVNGVSRYALTGSAILKFTL